MRILYLPLIDRGGANEQWDLLNIFRTKHHTLALDYLACEDPHKALQDLLKSFDPDVVHMQLQNTLRLEPKRIADFCKARPATQWVQWCGDVRDEPIQHVVDIGKVIDLTLVSARGMVSLYEERTGKPVGHWDHAVGDRFFTSPCESDGSVVFCAHNYHHFPGSEERRRLAGALKSSFPDRLKLFGNGWENATALPWELQPSVYRRAICTVGSNNYNDRDGYFSDRMFIAMAAGVPHVGRWVPGIDEFFHDGQEILTFKTVEEAIEKVQWVIAHPAEAAAIGRAGKDRVHIDHTWTRRLEQYEKLLTRIEK